MAGIYEEIEIEDMTYDDKSQIYYYPCPCGDKFEISLEELYDGEDIGTCPSCTLRIRVIFDEDTLPELREDDDDNPSMNKEIQVERVTQEIVQEITDIKDTSNEIKVEIITSELESVIISNNNNKNNEL